MSVDLYGYRYSVYAWIARFTLHEKGVDYTWVEINPFAEEVPDSYLAMHPFKRVPLLVHGEFVLYETTAITHYVDETFDGPALQPKDYRERARCRQIISIADNYAYWPLVRQVFSHGFLRPRTNRPVDADEIRLGLDAAPRVLAALESLASDASYLCGDALSLADLHLAPMLAYFASAPDGRALLEQYPRLSVWLEAMPGRPAYRATIPGWPAAQ
jgi:glutathione S-transferase